jgi:hypothetical protein
MGAEANEKTGESALATMRSIRAEQLAQLDKLHNIVNF